MTNVPPPAGFSLSQRTLERNGVTPPAAVKKLDHHHHRRQDGVISGLKNLAPIKIWLIFNDVISVKANAAVVVVFCRSKKRIWNGTGVFG